MRSVRRNKKSALLKVIASSSGYVASNSTITASSEVESSQPIWGTIPAFDGQTDKQH